MLSLILIKLNEEKAIYEFHPNASAEYGIIELDRKSNVAIVKEPLQGSELHTVHALNKLEEYGSLNSFPKEETLYDLAELFKVFGDSTRIKIICSLFESEMCVCDLSVLLNISQSAISHQLRVLKSARLVKFRRAGKVIYYSLDDEHIKQIFDAGLHHITE